MKAFEHNMPYSEDVLYGWTSRQYTVALQYALDEGLRGFDTQRIYDDPLKFFLDLQTAWHTSMPDNPCRGSMVLYRPTIEDSVDRAVRRGWRKSVQMLKPMTWRAV